MDLSKVLVISGKPDLSELVSQTRTGAIVKNLVSGVKYPVFHNDRMSALAEIRIFTNDGDEPLEDVFTNLHKVQEGNPIAFDIKKAEHDQLFDLFAKALPQYDTYRVHTSDVKKVFTWYNILLNAGKFVESASEENQDAESSKQE